MNENGNLPEIYLHPLDQRGDFAKRTFFADGMLGRMIAELDEDLQPHTVVEILSPDGDEVACRVPVEKNFSVSDGMALVCVENALNTLAKTSLI